MIYNYSTDNIHLLQNQQLHDRVTKIRSPLISHFIPERSKLTEKLFRVTAYFEVRV